MTTTVSANEVTAQTQPDARFAGAQVNRLLALEEHQIRNLAAGFRRRARGVRNQTAGQVMGAILKDTSVVATGARITEYLVAFPRLRESVQPRRQRVIREETARLLDSLSRGDAADRHRPVRRH
jgi:hypothetical protein